MLKVHVEGPKLDDVYEDRSCKFANARFHDPFKVAQIWFRLNEDL